MRIAHSVSADKGRRVGSSQTELIGADYNSFRLSALGFQLSAFGYRLSAEGRWLKAEG
jgi:hypothetical protein